MLENFVPLPTNTTFNQHHLSRLNEAVSNVSASFLVYRSVGTCFDHRSKNESSLSLLLSIHNFPQLLVWVIATESKQWKECHECECIHKSKTCKFSFSRRRMIFLRTPNLETSRNFRCQNLFSNLQSEHLKTIECLRSSNSCLQSIAAQSSLDTWNVAS